MLALMTIFVTDWDKLVLLLADSLFSRHDHGIRGSTKIAVYRAVVLTALLYGCETLYRRHTLKLDQFHLICSRNIANT